MFMTHESVKCWLFVDLMVNNPQINSETHNNSNFTTIGACPLFRWKIWFVQWEINTNLLNTRLMPNKHITWRTCEDFFKGRFWGNFCNMVNIFTCRCANRSGVGAIDSPDRFEQVLDQRYIPEVSEKIFTHDISMIRRQKMVIFGVLKVFISNFTYYNLY